MKRSRLQSFPFLPLSRYSLSSFIQRARRTWASESHSGRRWRAIGLSMATSMSDRVISGICSLVQVPLALSFLGQEAFGLWMTLTSLVTIMYIADFGLGVGTQNKISEAYGKEDIPAAQRAAGTGIVMLGLIGVSLFILCAPLCFLIDWGAMFHVHDPLTRQQTGAALCIMVAAFCLGLPLTASYRIVAAFQLIWMTNVKNSITNVATVILIAIAVWLKLGLLPFVGVVVAPQLVGNFILLAIFYRRMGWSPNLFLAFDHEMARGLFQKNWLFILPSIGGAIMGFAPPLLISSLLGASVLTPYNLIQRLLGLASQAQAMFIAPLWPAYTEAVVRGDIGWARATYRKSLLISFVFAVVPALFFILFGRWALFLWSHRPAESFETTLIVSLSIWTAISNFSQPPAILLNALGKIKGQASYGLASVLISLAMMPALISRFGASGAPLSLMLVFGLIALPLVLWEATYHLRQMMPTTNPDSASSS